MQGNKKFVIGSVVAIGLVAVTYFAYEHLTYVSSDDAQVGAHVVMLSSKVSGTIQKVLVEENQKVRAGDVLAQIDTSDYSNASDAAEAQVASLQARFLEAESGLKRAQELFKSQAIPQERLDAAEASYKEFNARLKAARTQLDQANLNVSYTKVIAPEDGTIARKSVERGQYAPAGQPLFGFVSTNERWITANLKETELAEVHPGRDVSIEIDSLPGRVFSGQVESVSPSTGAIFSLLPPDNTTGNFTKVVQRIPVRIKFVDLRSGDTDLLRAGLSAMVAIRVR